MQLRAGATLLLNLVQECDAEVARLCDALDCRVGANAYAAWEKTSSFGLHWDDHELEALAAAPPGALRTALGMLADFGKLTAR